jgi:tetratricopeptide (TPR) repeat protein
MPRQHSRGWSSSATGAGAKPTFGYNRSDPSLSNVKSVVDTGAPTEAMRHTRRRKQEQNKNLRRAKAVGGSLGSMSREEAIERCMAMNKAPTGRRERSTSRERSVSRERGIAAGGPDALAPQLLELLQPELPSERLPAAAELEEALVRARELGDDSAALSALRAIVCREIVLAQAVGDGEQCLQRPDVQEHVSTVVVLSNAFAMAQLHAQVASTAKERDARVAQLLRLADQLTKRPFLPPDVSRRLRAVTLNNMGCFSRHRGRHHAALKYLHKALELELRDGGLDGGDPGATHLNLCATLSSLGRHQEAAEQAEMAVDSLFASLPRPADGSLSFLSHSAASVPLECGDTASLLGVAYSNLASEHESMCNFEAALLSLENALDLEDRFQLDPTHADENDPEQRQQGEARARLSERCEALQARILSEGRRRGRRSGGGRTRMQTSDGQKDPDEENYQPAQPAAPGGGGGARQPELGARRGPPLKTKAPEALRLPALHGHARASSALGLVDASATNASASNGSGPALQLNLRHTADETKFFNNAVPVEQRAYDMLNQQLQQPRPQSYSHFPPLLQPEQQRQQQQQQADLYMYENSRSSTPGEQQQQPSPYEPPEHEVGSLSAADLSDFPASFGFAPSAAAAATGGGGGGGGGHQSLLMARPMSRASASSAGGLGLA